MTKCKTCGHDNKLNIEPEARDFILKNAPEETDFLHAVMKFTNEYESMKNKIAYAAVNDEQPNRTLVETFKKYYYIMVNIDLDYNTCDCGECSDGLY